MTRSISARSLTRGERARRGALLLLIGATHLIAILWLASQSATRVLQVEKVTNLINIASSPGRTPVKAVAPLEPAKAVVSSMSPIVIARSPVALASEAPASSSSGAASGSEPGAGGCALGQVVGDAILGDAAAMAELEALPLQARTQADAVMLWDGAWPDPQPSSVAPSDGIGAPGALRGAVVWAISNSPPECRDAIVVGPRFIALPGDLRTTMVVIGSGQWRWADLLDAGATCRVGQIYSSAQDARCPATAPSDPNLQKPN